MRKLVFFAIVVVAFGAGPSVAVADTPATTTVQYVGPTISEGSAVVALSASQNSAAASSGFSCSAKATVVINATYTDDILDYTNTIYHTQLTCTAKVFKSADAIVSLDFDNAGVGGAGTGECSGSCSGVSATHACDCYDGVECSGTYQSFGNSDGTLASGYYFTSHSGGCTGGRYTIDCQVTSHKVTVDPFL